MGASSPSEYIRYLIGENARLESELDKHIQNVDSDTSQRKLLENEVTNLRQQLVGAKSSINNNNNNK